jgi:hypothetical protein
VIAGRKRAIALLSAAIILAGLAAIAGTRYQPPPRPTTVRPTLLLLTSLPLLFGEDFSLDDAGSPALKTLQARYKVVPISVTDNAELARGQLLLMAHPLAQTAENLVALDGWVRRGGSVMLLADPMLEWPNKRPLGDPLRPPPMFMDMGLLAHWGLRLDAPERRGPAKRRLGDREILTISPGSLSGTCRIEPDRLVARCGIGKGRAIIVADADLLDVDALGSEGRPNLAAVADELAKLDRK